jgi:hypothetical protein
VGREKDIQDITRFNNQAPTSPDHACGCEGHVLGEGELFGGAVEVGDSGYDEAPLFIVSYMLFDSDIVEGCGCVRARCFSGICMVEGKVRIYLHNRSPIPQHKQLAKFHRIHTIQYNTINLPPPCLFPLSSPDLTRTRNAQSSTQSDYTISS